MAGATISAQVNMMRASKWMCPQGTVSRDYFTPIATCAISAIRGYQPPAGWLGIGLLSSTPIGFRTIACDLELSTSGPQEDLR